MKKSIVTLCVVSALFGASSALAEDLNAIFKRVNDFIAQQNYTKAMTELSWANKEIEKMHMQKLQTFFPESLGAYSGGQTEANNTLGFTNLERTYKNNTDQSTVRVSLTGGASGNAQAGMGGLAQIGQMAAMFGGQGTGQDTFRINGRTATLQANQEAKSAELTVFMDSGSILKLDLTGSSNGDTLKTLAETIKLDDIDKYMRG